jgi:predicted RNA-binding Zn-ribbon protein involved in translation (DUF1610 family)
MGFCSQCGTRVVDRSEFCGSCDSVRSSQSMVSAAAGGRTATLAPPRRLTWHVAFATGQIGGPYTEEEIREMIARRQIGMTDSVVAVGGTVWAPVTRSRFARYIPPAAAYRPAATAYRPAATAYRPAAACPHCGTGMIAAFRASSASTALIVAGIFCTPFGIGIPMIIVGLIMRAKRGARYQCPMCGFRF